MTRVLFGLGNPGTRYASTRHNVGWQVLDELARAEATSFRVARFFPGDEGSYREGGEVVRLVKPTTFMNLCGPAYVRALEVYEVSPAEALVISDDFMLPFGRLRFRDGGSSGGHNGLKSIEEALGAQDYPRLRLGIGPVPPPQDPAAFVLQRYDAEQQKGLADLLKRGVEAARVWVAKGLEEAANRFNGGGT